MSPQVTNPRLLLVKLVFISGSDPDGVCTQCGVGEYNPGGLHLNYIDWASWIPVRMAVFV